MLVVNAPPRFGLALIPRSRAQFRDLALWAEQVGFDVVWVGDTLGDWIDPEEPFLDAWPVLAGLAELTERIRLGVLVANVSWRAPVEIARWAMTLDQLSGGRFEVGLGCGYVDDQRMAGPDVASMTARERVDRLDEGLVVVDRLLTGDTRPFSGVFSTYSVAAIAPGSVQRPRPPMTVAGVGPRVIRLAVRHADSWNTFVDTPTLDEFGSVAAARMSRVDQICREEGRDPSSLRRSLTVYFQSVDPWAGPAVLPTIVEAYGAMGFSEFVLYPPHPEQLRAATQVMKDLVSMQ